MPLFQTSGEIASPVEKPEWAALFCLAEAYLFPEIKL